MNVDQLANSLGEATDPSLAKQLFVEARDLEEAFALRRWKYTELDAGRFCEVAARIVYGVDSDKFNLEKGVDDCLKYLENNNVAHRFPDRKSANQLTKVIRATYKMRSQRGAVHVSPTYTANEIDSRFVVESIRWVLAELLRIFVKGDTEGLVAAVEELARFPIPMIREFQGRPLVQAVDLTTEEEVLVLLLHRRNPGLATKELVGLIPKDGSGVRRAIKSLANSGKRQIVEVEGQWQITDLGIARIEDRLMNSRVDTS